jgi:tRNA modification GTPase
MYVAAIDLSSRVEHALDFSEDELPEGFSESVSHDVSRLASLVERKLSTAREGRILREGALVVLCGRPNAGKSSLMNALLGEGRAIVSDEAGTTRDTIEEGAEIGGWPVRLVDTAGLREAEGEVEREGVRRAEALVAQADVVLHVIEPGDEAPAPPGIPPSAIRVFSKCDTTPPPNRPTTPPPNRPTTQLLTSAKTGEGIDALKDAIAARLGQIAAKSAEETGADVTTRQKEALLAARTALASANGALDAGEWTIAANELRSASEALGRLLGKVYSDDLLDALFSRFCVGK